MIPELANKQRAIAQLCERFDVLRLGVFGSAARATDWTDSSDLDVLVLFDRRAEPDYLYRYLGLAEGLETLFGRSVDLVTEYSVQSPAFRAEIDRDLIPLYERSGKATAA
jgi:predicted nucleotidyltransferase